MTSRDTQRTISTSATETAQLPSAAPQKSQKALSCTYCQSRKIRCDKKQPCYSCVKANVQCIPAVRAAPKRRERITKIIARLNQYEKYMKEHGISLSEDDSDVDDSSDTDRHQAIESGLDGSGPVHCGSRSLLDGPAGKIFADSETGAPRYIVNHALSEINQELADIKISDDVPRSQPQLEDFLWNIAFLSQRQKSFLHDNGDFTSYDGIHQFHPPRVRILKLWQIFLNNIHPIFTVLHAPTVERQVHEASADLANAPYDLQALMFSIYASAIKSLTAVECLELFGEEREKLLTNYRNATETALSKADFIISPQIITIQASVLYLISAWVPHNVQAMWFLSGITLRLAQSLSLHLDGGNLGLSPFDTQIRRRLWWAILVLDGRLSEISGAGITLQSRWDTKPPLNLNDDDLYPDMREEPLEHPGLTKVSLCLLFCDISRFSRTHATAAGFDGFWSKFRTIPAIKRDAVIDKFQQSMEQKYLRHCDLSIPLHSMIAVTIRRTVCKMKVAAFYPRLCPRDPPSEEQRNTLFSTCIKIMELDNYSFTTPALRGFQWYAAPQFQLDAFVYLVGELQHRTTGKEVEQAWQQIEEIYKNRRNMIENRQNRLFVALGALTLKAWNQRWAVLNKAAPESEALLVPSFIYELQLRSKLAPEASMAPSFSLPATPDYLQMHNPNDVMGKIGHPGSMPTQVEYPLMNEMAMDLSIDSMDWAIWNELLHPDNVPGVDDDHAPALWDEQLEWSLNNGFPLE